MPADSPAAIVLDRAAVKAAVGEALADALARLDEARAAVPPDRLAYSEGEAARLLGLNPHQLRDERRRHRVSASTVVGGRVRYLRSDLLAYLMRERTEAGGN